MTTPTIAQGSITMKTPYGKPISGSQILGTDKHPIMQQPPDPMQTLKRLEDKLDLILTLLMTPKTEPLATFEDLKAREHGEMLARAIREASR